MEFRILGPLEVARDGEPLALGAVQQRALLAVLVLRCGQAVPTGRLIDELWGERAPATAAKTVQVYVSHLRKALGAGPWPSAEPSTVPSPRRRSVLAWHRGQSI